MVTALLLRLSDWPISGILPIFINRVPSGDVSFRTFLDYFSSFSAKKFDSKLHSVI